MTRLNASEAKLVLRVIDLPAELCPRFEAGAEAGLALADDEADLVLDLVSDRLMTHGFDAAYRPTEEGRALERLIDRLSADDEARPARERP